RSDEPSHLSSVCDSIGTARCVAAISCRARDRNRDLLSAGVTRAAMFRVPWLQAGRLPRSGVGRPRNSSLAHLSGNSARIAAVRSKLHRPVFQLDIKAPDPSRVGTEVATRGTLS